ncbi:hypothetical protein Tco_1290404 [Tanacetum coccineum]
MITTIDSAKVVGKSEIANMAMSLFLVGKIVERRGEVYPWGGLGCRSKWYGIVTSNPFEVLNMVEKDIGIDPSVSFNSNGDDVNVRNSKDVNLENEDNDSENNVEEDDNETTSFMASKRTKYSLK